MTHGCCHSSQACLAAAVAAFGTDRAWAPGDLCCCAWALALLGHLPPPLLTATAAAAAATAGHGRLAWPDLRALFQAALAVSVGAGGAALPSQRDVCPGHNPRKLFGISRGLGRQASRCVYPCNRTAMFRLRGPAGMSKGVWACIFFAGFQRRGRQRVAAVNTTQHWMVLCACAGWRQHGAHVIAEPQDACSAKVCASHGLAYKAVCPGCASDTCLAAAMLAT
jgi:hypothetical protein